MNPLQNSRHTSHSLVRFDGLTDVVKWDQLAVEEPLEIRVAGKSLVVTLRTPGDDFDLAAGFLKSEGIIHDANEIRFIGYVDPEQMILEVALTSEAEKRALIAASKRNFSANSACGACGKADLSALNVHSPPIHDNGSTVQPGILYSLSAKMRAVQSTFEQTGGLHAAALFNPSGDILLLREDVGRHNAVDKLLGAALRGRIPLTCTPIVLVSGRLGFEIVQKTGVSQIPILCAVSAPSSLAVSMAESLGISLVGFLRGNTMNIYTHPHRIR